MSWATRCPTCATVFRVTPDQLRVSEGHVRCGRCDTVFNAQAQLFDLESGEPLPAVSTPLGATAAAPQDVAPSAPTAENDAWAEPSDLSPPEADTPATADNEPVWAELTQGERAHDHLTTDREEPALATWAPDEAAARMRSLLGEPVSTATPPAFAGDEHQPPLGPSPLFRSLDESKSPVKSRRLGFGLAFALLVFALPVQWAWLTSDELRARWPGVEALWLQACGGCAPVALRRLDGVVVAASSLQPTPQGQAYHLKVRVLNQGPWPVTPPWLDLALSDLDGKPLLRRSLGPDELGVKVARLSPGEQLEFEATFSLEGRLNGYEVGIFQP